MVLFYPAANMPRIPDEDCKSRYACQHPGCWRGASIGYHIYRTSPPDEPYRGACEEHLPLYKKDDDG